MRGRSGKRFSFRGGLRCLNTVWRCRQIVSAMFTFRDTSSKLFKRSSRSSSSSFSRRRFSKKKSRGIMSWLLSFSAWPRFSPLRSKHLHRPPEHSCRPPITVSILWGIHPIVLHGQKGHFWIMAAVVLKIKPLPRRFGAFTALDVLTLAPIPLSPTLLVFIGARLYPRLAT